MRTTFLAVLLLTSCGAVEDHQAVETAAIGLALDDAPATLSGAGGDRLLTLHYCLPRPPGGTAEPLAFAVSGLRVEILARGLQQASIWSLRYELAVDLNRDRRFGPGDTVLVSERDRDLFGPGDTGSYRVRLFCGEQLLGGGEWLAR